MIQLIETVDRVLNLRRLCDVLNDTVSQRFRLVPFPMPAEYQHEGPAIGVEHRNTDGSYTLHDAFQCTEFRTLYYIGRQTLRGREHQAHAEFMAQLASDDHAQRRAESGYAQ